jgi:anti-sigma regulatory factor (Ser/Thr protein kinase)
MTAASPEQGFPQVVRVTSETANIAVVRSAVLAAAEQVGFDESSISAIALAIDEAVTNVIRHGYEGRAGQPIEVRLDRVQRDGVAALQVTICDCARQVDPMTISGRNLEDVRPGGLGTHIIRTVMDEVEYSLRQPTGMQLRVLKKLKASSATASGTQAPCAKESS